jgi:purine nucleoside permease
LQFSITSLRALLSVSSGGNRKQETDIAIMLSSIPTVLLALASVATAALVPTAEIQQRSYEYVIKPKVFIISLFRPEAEIWHGIPEFDILAMNITVPGFSVLVSYLLDDHGIGISSNVYSLHTAMPAKMVSFD